MKFQVVFLLLLAVRSSAFLTPSRRCFQHRPLAAASKEKSLLYKNVLEQKNSQVLSDDPLVYLIPDFLSLEECRNYQQYVSDRNMEPSNPPAVSLQVNKLWPLPFLSVIAGLPPVLRLMSEGKVTSRSSTVELLNAALPNIAIAAVVSVVLAGLVLVAVQRFSATSSRTSVATALNLGSDCEMIRVLVDRVCEATNHPWQKWEAPVVTRYDPGAVFAKHGDASPTRGSEWKELGGQRVVTCICYLNTVESGGETYFDQLDLAVQPQLGSALVFFPADSSTLVADDRTTHESLPPQSEKWIVQLFGRNERVPPPLGIPDSFY